MPANEGGGAATPQALPHSSPPFILRSPHLSGATVLPLHPPVVGGVGGCYPCPALRLAVSVQGGGLSPRQSAASADTGSPGGDGAVEACPAPILHIAFPGGHCAPSESRASLSRPPGDGRVARLLMHLTHPKSAQHPARAITPAKHQSRPRGGAWTGRHRGVRAC